MGRKHLFKEPKEDCEVDTPPAKTGRLRLVGVTLCSENLSGSFQVLRFVSY